MSTTDELTLSEFARRAMLPASRIKSAIDKGEIVPTRRAGLYRNSPVMIPAGELDKLRGRALDVSEHPNR